MPCSLSHLPVLGQQPSLKRHQRQRGHHHENDRFVTFFVALSIFPLRPDSPFNLKNGYLPPLLNHLSMHLSHDLSISPPTPPPRSDPVKSPPSSDQPSSLNRSSPFSPFSHYHRHRQSPSRRSSILIRTHCRCQSSIPEHPIFVLPCHEEDVVRLHQDMPCVVP